jgi:cathepsin A (carboxypeptidase C)
VVCGQLIPEPAVDFAALKAEIGKQGLLSADEEPSMTITNPTLCDSSVKQHAGYIDVGDSEICELDGSSCISRRAKYFFWMFESRSNPETDPLVMWLNGGPGCSSMMGMLAENGPCTVNKDGKNTTLNKNSWNSNANVIWVDQPAATGFSTGLPVVHDEDGVASRMYTFMQGFYKALPQYASKDFYIFGESYAGHFVPAISHKIWEENKNGNGAVKVPLKGIGIGNGLTDPELQYSWYPEMAKDGGKSEGGTLQKGVITNIFAQAAMKAALVPCVKAIKSCNSGDSSSCTSAYGMCNYGELVPYQLTGYNPYDMRVKCQIPPLCYDFSQVDFVPE